MENELRLALDDLDVAKSITISQEIISVIGLEHLNNVLLKLSDIDSSGLLPFALNICLSSINSKMNRLENYRDILRLPLCHLPKAYESAIFIAKYIHMENKHNIKNSLILIDLGRNCTQKLSDQDVIALAKSIIEIEPNNEKAKFYLEYLQ